MIKKNRPRLYLSYIALAFCGTFMTSITVSAEADPVQVTGKNSTETSINQHVLVADGASNVHARYVALKAYLDHFLNDKKWTGKEKWGLRKSAEIKYQFDGTKGQITIPEIDAFFWLVDWKIQFKIGTIDVFTSLTNSDKMTVLVKIGKTFDIGFAGQGNSHGQIEISDKTISFDWDFGLETIVRHNIELNDVKLSDLSSGVGRKEFASIKQLKSTGDISETTKGQWQGNINNHLRSFALSNGISVSSAVSTSEIVAVDLDEYANAINGADRTGQLGGWYYGGLFTANLISNGGVTERDTINTLRALETVAKIGKKITSNLALNDIEVFDFRLKKLFANEYFETQNQSTNYTGSVNFEQFGLSDANNTESQSRFLPTSLNIPFSVFIDSLPEIYRVLTDAEVSHPGLIATIIDGRGTLETLNRLRPVLTMIVNSGGQIRMNAIRIAGDHYDININTEIEASDKSEIGFIAEVRIDATYDELVMAAINVIANESPNKAASVFFQQLEESTEKSSDNDFQTRLIASIDKAGHLEINGLKFGEPLASLFPANTSPTVRQKSLSKNSKNDRIDILSEKNSTIRQRLLRLKSLEANGLITPAEAADKRKKILDEL